VLLYVQRCCATKTRDWIGRDNGDGEDSVLCRLPLLTQNLVGEEQMRRLGRRRFLSAVGGSLCATTSLSLSAGGARGAVKSFIALGDSYTASFRNGIPSWAQQIKNSGVARHIVNLALSGATITGANTMGTFDGQVDVWIRSYKSQGIPDRTVVYVGYNNIGDAMTTVRNAYSRQIDRLIANGITQSQRKLVLCLLHDRSRDPRCATLSYKNSVRPWVVEWNMFVRSRRLALELCSCRPVHPVRECVQQPEFIWVHQRNHR
jgi:hypothetical protein